MPLDLTFAAAAAHGAVLKASPVDTAQLARNSNAAALLSIESDAARTCWVGGIPGDVGTDQLQQLFEAQFGECESVVLRDKEKQPGKSDVRSWAFVKFVEPNSAAKAIAAGEAGGVTTEVGGAVLNVRPVDTTLLTAKQQGSAMVGSSAGVWRATRS